jgi:hypothetical protein
MISKRSPIIVQQPGKKEPVVQKEDRQKAVLPTITAIGGGSKGSGSGEESSIQTMFGQMFGAAAPADAAAGISAGMQMASLGAPGATGDKPTSNIFQYATYRYRILAHQEERVHLRGGSKSANSIASSSALPSREPASKPSSLPDSSAVDQAIAQVLSSSSSHSSSDSDSE